MNGMPSTRSKKIWLAVATLAPPAAFVFALISNFLYGSPVPPVGAQLASAGKWLTDNVTETVAPLIGQGYKPTYPVAGEKIPAQDHCNVACVIAHMPDDKEWIQLGPTTETGFFYVDAPPDGCAFISAQISRTPIKTLTARPATVLFDGAPKEALQDCNPKVRLGKYDFGYQVPAWYRSENWIVVSVPKKIPQTDANYRLTVCAYDTDGNVFQFVGDHSRDYMQKEDGRRC